MTSRGPVPEPPKPPDNGKRGKAKKRGKATREAEAEWDAWDVWFAAELARQHGIAIEHLVCTPLVPLCMGAAVASPGDSGWSCTCDTSLGSYADGWSAGREIRELRYELKQARARVEALEGAIVCANLDGWPVAMLEHAANLVDLESRKFRGRSSAAWGPLRKVRQALRDAARQLRGQALEARED